MLCGIIAPKGGVVMASFHLSESDVALILRALDALEDEIGGEPFYLVDQIRTLKVRFSAHLSSFSGGELRNVVDGLHLLLRENPLDWNASQLLAKLNHHLEHPNL